MTMSLNLVLSYLLSFVGVKYLYKGSDQRSLISLGLFIGSITAFVTLIIYFLSKMDGIYIPIIFCGLLLLFEYYSNQQKEAVSGSDFDQYIQTDQYSTIDMRDYSSKPSNNKINMFLDEEENNNSDAMANVNIENTDLKNDKSEQNNKKVSIDDLIK